MPPKKKKVPNMESNLTSEQDSEEEVSRREEEEERTRQMEKEEEMRLRKEEEEQDLENRLREARKDSDKQRRNSDDEEREDNTKTSKEKENEEDFHREGSSRDKQGRRDKEKESKDSLKDEFHRIVISNEDLADAVDILNDKRQEMKQFESWITRQLKDIKMRKKITGNEIHYERVRFEETYYKHVESCKAQVNVILATPGLSRKEKETVRKSTADLKAAMYRSYDHFTDEFNIQMREIEIDADRTTPQDRERSSHIFQSEGWRPNPTFEPDKKLDINNGFTSYRRWEASVELFFDHGRGKSKPTSKQTTSWIERFLCESLDTEMKHQWDINPDVTFEECFKSNMEIVEKCFMDFFPLDVRRSVLFEWKMPDIEKPEEGVVELKKILKEAHFNKITEDEYAIHVATCQTGNKELKKAILTSLREKGTTMKVFIETIKDFRRIERTILNDERIDETKRVGRVEVKQKPSDSRESSKERSGGNGYSGGGYKGRNLICFRCGAKHYIKECKEKPQSCPEPNCGRDHFRSGHEAFVKWRKSKDEKERGERGRSPGRSHYRDRSKSREREKERDKPYKKKEKEEKKDPKSETYKKEIKTKRKIKMVEVTTDDEETESEEEVPIKKQKSKKLRRIRGRSPTPRPRSSYYKEVITDEEDSSENEEPKRVRRVKNSTVKMVKKSREKTDEEYNFLMRETFDDKKINHEITATLDTGAQQTVCGAKRAKEMQLTHHPNVNNITLQDASGNPMPVIGIAHLYVIPEGGRIPKFIEMAITTSMEMEILISPKDQKKLAILSPKYPDYCREWDEDEVKASRILSVNIDSDYETDAYNSDEESIEEEEDTHDLADTKPETRRASVIIEGKPEPTLDFSKDLDKDVLNLAREYSDVFNEFVDRDRVMDTEPMKIELRSDKTVIPIYVANPRQIPLHWRHEAKSLLTTMIDAGILRPVTSPRTWCSPVCFVRKGDGEPLKLRLTNDFRVLNSMVLRVPHPFPSVKEIKQNIRGDTTYLISADFVSGYHQIELDEDSRHLTSFASELGILEYCRVPQGLSVSGDVFCRMTDSILANIDHLKLIDDILIQSETKEGALKTMREILERCREFNVTLSPKKLKSGQKLSFAGFVIDCEQEGGPVILQDPMKTQAIREWAEPRNKSELQTFLGAANQLSSWTPCYSHIATHLRKLTAKDARWSWETIHQLEFDTIKSVLSNTEALGIFAINKDTVAIVDGSRLFGLGWCLVQKQEDGSWKLIACGSRALTKSEARWSVFEIEVACCSFLLDESSLLAPRCECLQDLHRSPCPRRH